MQNTLKQLPWKLYSSIGTTSKIFRAQQRFHIWIKKQYNPDISLDTFYNESHALELLYQKKHFSKLLCIDTINKTIYMEYLGKTLCKQNCPKNWKEQIEEILVIFEKLNIFISDIQRNNICVLNGIINIIDFGVVDFNYFNYGQLKSRFTHVFNTLV